MTDLEKLRNVAGVQGLISPKYLDTNLRRGIDSSSTVEWFVAIIFKSRSAIFPMIYSDPEWLSISPISAWDRVCFWVVHVCVAILPLLRFCALFGLKKCWDLFLLYVTPWGFNKAAKNRSSEAIEQRKERFGDNILPQAELMSFFEHISRRLGIRCLAVIFVDWCKSVFLTPLCQSYPMFFQGFLLPVTLLLTRFWWRVFVPAVHRCQSS